MKVKIRDLSHDGKGIGTLNDKTVFVENSYPTEEVEIEITKEKKKIAFGKTKEILQKSEDRIESICEDFYHCNGCQYCDYKYSAQLNSKVKRVKDNFRKLAGIEVEDIKIHGMDDFYNYRNHIQLKIKKDKIGYVDKENFSVFTPKNCIVAPKKTKEIINILQNWEDIDKFSLLGIRENHKGEILLVLVTEKKPKDLKLEKIQNELKDLGVSHIYININKNPKYHYGKESILVMGEGDFYDEILGHKFILSPTSFFQVNRKQAEILYKIGIENLDLNNTDKVLELYSGVGTISMVIGEKAEKVLGIEYAKSSVEDAKKNKELNGFENIEFVSGKVEEKLAEFKKYYNKILLDPPRAGADKKVIEAIIKANPEKISYISCAPATLARDVKILVEDGGYKLESVEIVDMFPMTSHVESIILMTYCGLESEK